MEAGGTGEGGVGSEAVSVGGGEEGSGQEDPSGSTGTGSGEDVEAVCGGSIEREFGHIDENWHFNDKQKEVRRTDSIAGLFLQGVLGLALLKLWNAEQAGPARRKTRQQAAG